MATASRPFWGLLRSIVLAEGSLDVGNCVVCVPKGSAGFPRHLAAFSTQSSRAKGLDMRRRQRHGGPNRPEVALCENGSWVPKWMGVQGPIGRHLGVI